MGMEEEFDYFAGDPMGRGRGGTGFNPDAEKYRNRVQKERDISFGHELAVIHTSDEPHAVLRASRNGLLKEVKQQENISQRFQDRWISNIPNHLNNRATWLIEGGDPDIVWLMGYDSEQVGSQAHKIPPHLREPMIRVCHSEVVLWSAVGDVETLSATWNSAGGSMDQLAKGFLNPLTFFPTPSDMEAILNASPTIDLSLVNLARPEVQVPPRLKEKGETESLGVNIDIAMRAYLVVTYAERPHALRELRNTPGWRKIFPTREEEEKWLGHIDSWRGEADIPEERRTKGDVQRERESGSRGALTSRGNIFSRKENAADRDSVRQAVRDLVKGDELAEEIAWQLFRASGLAASGATQFLWEPEGQDIAGNDTLRTKGKMGIMQEGFPTTDDSIKIFSTMEYVYKMHENRGKAGPYWVRGRTNRLATDLLRFTVIEPDESTPPQDKKQYTQRRTAFEKWWGYQADSNNPQLGYEEALRLGEIFTSGKLKQTFWRDWELRRFIAGREGGFLDKMMRIKWDPKDLQVDGLEQMNTEAEILFGDSVVFGGRLRGYTGEEISKAVSGQKRRAFTGVLMGMKSEPVNAKIIGPEGLGIDRQTGWDTIKTNLRRIRGKDRGSIYGTDEHSINMRNQLTWMLANYLHDRGLDPRTREELSTEFKSIFEDIFKG